MIIADNRRSTLLLIIAILASPLYLFGQTLFYAPDVIVDPATNISVPIKIDSFENITTVQFTFEWDSTILVPKSVGDFGLNLKDTNFNILRDSGLLTFSWFDNAAAGVSLEDSSTIFSINFEVKDQPGRTTSLDFTDRITIKEVADTSFIAIEATFVNGSVTLTGTSSLIVNESSGLIKVVPSGPNPFREEIRLKYILQRPLLLSRKITNLAGQILVNDQIQFVQGLNEMRIDRSLLKANGIYFIELVTEGKKISQRIVAH